jgi:hypothetical protein
MKLKRTKNYMLFKHFAFLQRFLKKIELKLH